MTAPCHSPESASIIATSSRLRIENLTPEFGRVISGDVTLSEVDTALVRNVFRNAGVILFRGFGATREEFRTFSASLSREFAIHLNRAREPVGDRTMTGVTPGASHVFAHAEMGYTPLRPDVAWFYCECPAAAGGETVVYDGVRVLAAFARDTRYRFESKRLLFAQTIAEDDWLLLAPSVAALTELLDRFKGDSFSFELDDSRRLHMRFLPPAVSPTRFGEQLAFCNSLLDFKSPLFADGTPVAPALLRDVIVTTEELAVPVHCASGDVLMVDNSRCMHGRRAFTDHRRRVLVRFSYLD